MAAGIAGAALTQPNTTTPYGTVTWSNPEYEAALAAWEAQNPNARTGGAPTAGSFTPGTDPSLASYGGVPGASDDANYAHMLLNTGVGAGAPGSIQNAQIGQELGLPTPGHVLGKGDDSTGGTYTPSPYETWQAARPRIEDYATPGSFERRSQFSPEIQALFDRATGSPVDFAAMGLPEFTEGAEANRNKVEEALYRRSTRYLDEQRGAREADLLNRGFNMGQEGYNANLQQFDEQYGDARDRAILMGGQEASRTFGENLQSRQQLIAELLRQRSLPIEELSQIAGFLPAAGGGASPNIGSAPILDALNQQYGAALQGFGIESQQAGSQAAAGAGALTALLLALI